MADYVDVGDAIGMAGLRLVLSTGVPGPWGESAKSIFHVKEMPYTRVRQLGGMENRELAEWTGRDNAPLAVYENEAARDGWVEILDLAERLAPEPRLIPVDVEQRVRMFGLSREICGENGFGWLRRLMLLAPMFAEGVPEPTRAVAKRLGDKYGYSAETAREAGPRAAEILGQLSRELLAQRAAGSRYFIGDTLSALDIYWACFAALLQPLPEEACPMPAMLRAAYSATDPVVLQAADPVLLEHRDYVYEKHLELPLDF